MMNLDWTCDCGCLNGTTNQVCRRCGAKPRCMCAAHNSDECACGAWDDQDPYWLKLALEDMIITTEGLLLKKDREVDALKAKITELKEKPCEYCGRINANGDRGYVCGKPIDIAKEVRGD